MNNFCSFVTVGEIHDNIRKGDSVITVAVREERGVHQNVNVCEQGDGESCQSKRSRTIFFN